MKSAMQTQRPSFLDLRKIRLPLPGIVSILHRISGVLMVLAIPFSLYLLELSLRSAEGFIAAQAIVDSFFVKLGMTLILWSIAHHLFAGIRFLLLDIDIAVEREQTRKMSVAVLAASVVTVLLFLGVIW